MNKEIINYATSGLGNRLRSLASCYVISQDTGRSLKLYWDIITPNGCLARFDELFENQITNISLEELETLSDCQIFSEHYDVIREFDKFGRRALKVLVEKYGASGKDNYSNSDASSLVVFNNNFLQGVSLKKSHEFLQGLVPVSDIREKISSESERLGLSKGIIGIHARGTDFGVPLNYYTDKISDTLKNNPDSKFFLSTEDPDFEKKICEDFPGKIITGKKDFYIKREDINDSWQNHNNFFITKEHAKEAVLDIFLLSKTNIEIYHPHSTFCEIARIISLKK